MTSKSVQSMKDQKDKTLIVYTQVLLLSHPYNQTRDTSRYGPLRELAGTKRPSLKTLAKKALGLDIQEGEHSSVSGCLAAFQIQAANDIYFRSLTQELPWQSIVQYKSNGRPA